MTILEHARASAEQFGGIPADYYDFHAMLDAPNAYCNDNRYRFLYSDFAMYKLLGQLYVLGWKNSSGTSTDIQYLNNAHSFREYNKEDIPGTAIFAAAIQPADKTAFRKKLDACFTQFIDNEKAVDYIISPFSTTYQLDSLLLTLNSFFIDVLKKKLPEIAPAFVFTPAELFTHMQYDKRMDDGAPAIPDREDTYIIRQMAFRFSDQLQCYEEIGEGAIVATCSNRGDAHTCYYQLQRTAILNCYLDEYPMLCRMDLTSLDYHREQLHNYMIQEFDIAVLNDKGELLKQVKVPAHASQEQITQLLDLCWIDFYTMHRFKETPSFYVLESDQPAKYPRFFNTIDSLVSNLHELVTSFSLQGKVQELSDTPGILQYIIDKRDEFMVDEHNDTIHVEVNMQVNEDVMLLVQTLKNKPFTIKTITLEEASRIDQNRYLQP